MLKRLMLPLLFVSTPALAQLSADEAALKAHVAFLADDTMKGRDTGTPEFDIAANYVATRMMAAGLSPGGDDGSWFQDVPLVSYRAADKGSFAVRRGPNRVPLVWGEDFVPRANPLVPDVALSGDVVFVGYGLSDPATGHDDYRGLDVTGKIVAVLRAAPASLPSEIRAHFSGPEAKVRAAAAHGAIGVILIESTARHAVAPFASSVRNWDSTAMTWAEPDGSPHVEASGAPAFVYLGFAGAGKLFAGSRLDWQKVLAADKAGRKLPTGALGVAAEGRSRTEIARLTSRNIVGRLEGSDPALKAETIVLSAHVDHVGVGRPDATGDTIYNGAMDNALGTASMLEVARAFQASGRRPRRSMMFVAVTAEEKGLVGSEYFAAHPTASAGTIVADVNLDMPILTYRFEDLVAYGAERTSIGPVVAAVAGKAGLVLTPDPEPDQASFVRSDHYSFVKAGIPAVSLEPGPKGPGKAAGEDFIRNHYHKPSDAITLPIDWGQGARFVRINYDIARALADAEDRPRWNKGDFFGMLYQGFGAN